ncbi:MAG: hypothetical protein JXX28_04710 [Deltaproteobacteria bacterium]|nr:hypothetical protein [Deltaproteobacteria bacterium]
MTEPVLQTDTSRALWTATRGGFTGRLSLPASSDSICVMLMGGEIIAAEAPNDIPSLLGRLAREGHLYGKFARDLLEQWQRGTYIMDSLSQALGPEYLDHVLMERFKENLRIFLGNAYPPVIAEDTALFPVNMQLGLNTEALIRDCSEDWLLAHEIDGQADVIAGSVPPGQELEVRLTMMASDPIAIHDLLPYAYLEPTAARALVARLLRQDKLAYALEELGEAALEELEDAALEELPGEDRAPSDELDDSEALTEVHGEPEEVVWGLSDGADAGEDWTGESELHEEEELDAFGDYDEDRGSTGDGTFTTDNHNLDRVEVAAENVLDPASEDRPIVDEVQRSEVYLSDDVIQIEEFDEEEPERPVQAPQAPPEDDEVIEADEGPRASFGAPPLAEDEAEAKIQVANEVLHSFVKAFDSAHGSGGGRAHLQILVDGSPSKFKDLFRDVPVHDDGTLSSRVVMRNLRFRPVTEHRRSLNDALADLIERSLSMAADDLPDDEFDAMYEEVAGYRQRLGL